MKIGDKVEVLVWNPDNDPDINPFSAGTIGVIVDYCFTNDNTYKVESNGQAWWYKERDLRQL